MAADVNKETLGFQSEVKQLLDLMIHSLYSNREIFIRELISNASDACDKLRFEALSNDALFEGDSELNVHVEFDEKKKTITFRDNGIGMTREEVIEHIGTIAKSGTKEFFSAITGDEKKDSQLIGQFGVGFYSAFIVAESVTLTTRRAGASEDEGVRWESEGQGEYTIESVKRKERGTEVVLHLRKDAKEFLNGYELRQIIRKYSDHLNLPIIMLKESHGEEGDKKEIEYETVNSAKALWARSKKEITDEEYNEFYKHIGHDYEDPLARIHSQVEGNLEYTTLFYIPGRAPFDMWDRNQKHGIKLYVRRVFIMDDAEQLLPPYLRFVRGIVDTNDLPLNVSREILQHNKVIEKIKAASVKKILTMIGKLAKGDDYDQFWKEFGKVLKEGLVDDDKNKDKLAKLLRFATTHDDVEDQKVSLEDYVGRMQEEQKNIFYVVGESFATVKNSPHLEVFRKKGIEVLLLTDHVDEWLVNHLTEFDGKELQSITKGELDLGDIGNKEEEQKETEEKTGEYKDVLKRLEELLTDEVKEVRVTNRLTTSPACLVAGDQDMEANLQRILEASGQAIPLSKRVLEINPDHPILVRLKAEKDDDRFNDWGKILFDQALLSEGGKLEDPAGFVHRLNEMFVEISS